jgi:hypothetical protein
VLVNNNKQGEYMKTKLILGVVALLLSVTAQANTILSCTGGVTGGGLVKNLELKVVDKAYQVSIDDVFGSSTISKAQRQNSLTSTQLLIEETRTTKKSIAFTLNGAKKQAVMIYALKDGSVIDIEILDCK